MIKGDAVRRGFVGKILSRIEDKGLKIVAMKMAFVALGEAEKLYEEHKSKEFYGRLIAFTTGTPVVLLKVRGNSAITVVRAMIGATDCCKAAAGTIRGDFGCSSANRTLVHASRTEEDAYRESCIFFDDVPFESEEYKRCDEGWTLETEVEK